MLWACTRVDGTKSVNILLLNGEKDLVPPRPRTHACKHHRRPFPILGITLSARHKAENFSPTRVSPSRLAVVWSAQKAAVLLSDPTHPPLENRLYNYIEYTHV